MAITLVQSKSTKGVGVGSVSATFASTPTAGNAVLVGTSGWANAAASGNVTDNKSNAYAFRQSPDATNVHSAIYDCLNISSSATFTVTYNPTGPNNDTDIAIHEVSGLDTAGFDVGNERTGTGSLYDTNTTAATAQNDELAFAVFTSEGTSGTTTLGGTGTYTKAQEIVTTANMPICTAYQVLTATGAQNATLSANSFNWAACITTYKAAGVGGGGPTAFATKMTLMGTGRA